MHANVLGGKVFGDFSDWTLRQSIVGLEGRSDTWAPDTVKIGSTIRTAATTPSPLLALKTPGSVFRLASPRPREHGRVPASSPTPTRPMGPRRGTTNAIDPT